MRCWTVTQAIDFVLWEAERPLTASEIFRRLPATMLPRPLSRHAFWQFFGMMLKRKRSPIYQTDCGKRCRCYYINKRDY